MTHDEQPPGIHEIADTVRELEGHLTPDKEWDLVMARLGPQVGLRVEGLSSGNTSYFILAGSNGGVEVSQQEAYSIFAQKLFTGDYTS